MELPRRCLAWLNQKSEKHGALIALFSAIAGGLLVFLLQRPQVERALHAAEKGTRLSELQASNANLRTRMREGQSKLHQVQEKNAGLSKEIQLLEAALAEAVGEASVDLAVRVGELSGQLQAARQTGQQWEAQLKEAGIEPWVEIDLEGDGR